MCVSLDHSHHTHIQNRATVEMHLLSLKKKKKKELFIQLQKCGSADSLGISLSFQADITLFLGSSLAMTQQTWVTSPFSFRSILQPLLKLPVRLINTSSALFWRLRLSLPILLPSSSFQAYLWCDRKRLTVGSDLRCLSDFFGVNTSTPTSFSLSVGHR